jgi:homoserine kinase
MVVVRVPASSANLGPGFDVLGMALSLHLEASPGRDLPEVEAGHPAMVAFRRLGGDGPLGVRSPIPASRGLGFSGAARVAGLAAALVQRGEPVDRDLLVQHGAALEGHADNVAASVFGGVVASTAGVTVRVPLAVDPVIVAWVPSALTTSTDESRGRLRRAIDFDDAVFAVGRTALLVSALASGDLAALRTAVQDRLHQPIRLTPVLQAVMDAALDAGAWCAWLSGSGPTMAAMCSPEVAGEVADALPIPADVGAVSVKRLRIDHEGVRVEIDEP